MLSNSQKKEFLESIFERIPQDAKDEDVQKEIIELLMVDTNQGKMYKYRKFNDYALSNLEAGTLYCAVPSSFNDPFDCRIGIDIQSSITPRFSKAFEGIEDCINIFTDVLDGKVSMDMCAERERMVLNNWFNSEHLYEFVKRYRGSDISNEELKELLGSNIEILVELLEGYSVDIEFLKQMEQAKEEFSTFSNMDQKQRILIMNEDSSFEDFARSYGVEEDTDEIGLVRLLYQKQKPEKADFAQKADDELKRVNRELGESIDRQYRVGSLCTDYKNCLMWSHYADGHKGFCIEYDFGSEPDALKDILLLPVIYSKERVKFPWGVAFAPNKEDEKVKREAAYAMLLSLLTKDEVWSYENEWRVIVTSSLEIQNVKMPSISCIYIGALCSDENKETLIKIAKELNVPVKQMVVDRGEYTLHAQECI